MRLAIAPTPLAHLKTSCYPIVRNLTEANVAEKERAPLTLSKDGRIATITIDNFKPVTLAKGIQQTNTLDAELFDEIDRRLDEIEKINADCVVFTGIGQPPGAPYPVFCDGIDLTVLANLKFQDFSDDMKREVGIRHAGVNVLNRIRDMSQYFIARINGFCIGGGLELALGCDHLISLPKILIGFPEAKFGILPGWNGLQNLAAKIGEEKACKFFFEGFFRPSGKHLYRNGIVTAEEAFRLGIVDAIVQLPDWADLRISVIAEEFSFGRRHRRQKPKLEVFKMMPE